MKATTPEIPIGGGTLQPQRSGGLLMTAIRALAEIVFMVDDIERSLAFYRDTQRRRPVTNPRFASVPPSVV